MDSRLLKELYKKYQRELFLYIFSLCRNREMAEDLTQETFLKAMLSLSESHSNIKAWLYTVARNLYLNLLKKEKGRVDMDEITEFVDETDVIEDVILSESKRLCYQALQSLDKLKREVLVLQYFGGLSQKEISAVLHTSPENVRVLGYRGKKEMKKYLEAKGYDI